MSPIVITACAKEELTSYLGGGIATLLIALFLGVYTGVRRCTGKGELEVASVDQHARLPVLDNAKFIAMCTVIIISELHPHGDLPGRPETTLANTQEEVKFALPVLSYGSAITHFLHPFGARFFCFISGMWSERPLHNARGTLLIRLGAPLVCACCFIQPLDNMFLGPGPWKPANNNAAFFAAFAAWRTLIVPGDEPYWYLEALIVWRVMASLIEPYRLQARFGIAVCIAVFAGAVVPVHAPFALGQAVVLFPVYMLGQVFPLHSMLSLFPWALGSCLIACVVMWEVYLLESSAFGTLFLTNVPDYGWSGVKYCSPADALTFWLLGLFRLVWDLGKGLLLLVFICPRCPCRVSVLGQNTLYALVLHKPLVRFAVKLIITMGLMPEMTENSEEDMNWWEYKFAMGMMWALVIAFALGVSVLTCSPRIREIGQVFMEPVWLEAWISQPPEPESDPDPDKEDASLLDCEGDVGDGL